MKAEIKRRKITSIKEEVKGFHPLLKTLFQAMPEFEHVDYTHGANENGADFVLTRFDKLLGETFYIGVIAKTGKIQIDFTDVERQVDECSLARYALNGKKDICITEVWVINNDTISANAEKKINLKFKDKKIVFLDYQKVIRWIDEFLPNYWFEFGVKTGEYLSNLNNRMLELDRQYNLLKCSDEPFYIQQDIYEVEPEYSQENRSKSKRVDIFIEPFKKKVTIIEGSMGAGKSKLMRRLAKHFSTGEVFAEIKIIPVFCSYEELIDKHDSNVQKLIEDKVNQEAIEEFNDSNKYLLLIDAVDENKASDGDQIEKLGEAVALLNESQNIYSILTTRPLRGYDKNKEILNNAKLLEIRPLSISRIVEFLRKICDKINISNRIIEDLKKSALFKELPKSPIAAILLADLLNEKSKELPANITELYCKYTELALGRWDIEKGLQSQKEYEAADSIVMLLADYFIENGLSEIAIGEAKSFFTRYLKSRNLGMETDQLFEKVSNRSGLLLINQFSSTVTFKHKSFAEFMYAKLRDKKNDLKIDTRIYDIYWDNIFFFFIGLKKDCPELLREIISVEPKNNPQRFHRIINLSNYLLAGFSSPYEVVDENLHKIMLEAAEFYLQIIKKHIETPFVSLPEIHILCLFQYIIRESYGYSFFKDAIDAINIKIVDSSHSDDIKLYALFFTGVTAMELSYEDPFDFLLAEYGDKLPIQLKLGISHESEKLQHLSTYVKRNLKKLKQLAKASKSTRNLIESLYKEPLDVRKIT